jgi:ubiquinone/menaquinone biosynthesis C-methylase UbiE
MFATTMHRLSLLMSDHGIRTDEYRRFPNVEGRNQRQEYIEIPLMAWALGLPKGLRVLEVGCGRGVALPVFHELLEPTRLVGLDIDESLLAQAEHRVRRAGIPSELVHGDVRDMPFPDSSFDLVVDFGTCYHIANPHWAFLEVYRVLTLGGRFVYETRLAQLLSHPIRSLRRSLPTKSVPPLVSDRNRLLWSMRRKVGRPRLYVETA